MITLGVALLLFSFAAEYVCQWRDEVSVPVQKAPSPIDLGKNPLPYLGKWEELTLKNFRQSRGPIRRWPGDVEFTPLPGDRCQWQPLPPEFGGMPPRWPSSKVFQQEIEAAMASAIETSP